MSVRFTSGDARTFDAVVPTANDCVRDAHEFVEYEDMMLHVDGVLCEHKEPLKAGGHACENVAHDGVSAIADLFEKVGFEQKDNNHQLDCGDVFDTEPIEVDELHEISKTRVPTARKRVADFGNDDGEKAKRNRIVLVKEGVCILHIRRHSVQTMCIFHMHLFCVRTRHFTPCATRRVLYSTSNTRIHIGAMLTRIIRRATATIVLLLTSIENTLKQTLISVFAKENSVLFVSSAWIAHMPWRFLTTLELSLSSLRRQRNRRKFVSCDEKGAMA